MPSYINLLDNIRQNLAKKSSIPSGVASADNDKKKVKEALDQTDPERKSQVLPKFANMMEQIMQLLGSIGMGQGGGGGGGQQQPQPQAGNPNTAISYAAIHDIGHGLAGALEIEANTKGLELVMSVYNAILGNNIVGQANYNSLISDYQSIVTEAANLFNSDIAANTLMNSVIVPINSQIVANSTNSEIPPNVVMSVPDFYYQVQLPADQIPYYGYTEWASIGNVHNVVYTPVDYNTTPVFAYLNDSIIYEIQESLVADLDPYFAQANLAFDTFVSILDSILDTYVSVIDNASFGNGNMVPSQSSNTQNQQQNQNQQQQQQNQNNNMVGQLLPVLNQLIQAAQSEHLPKSILDKEKVKKCLDNHGQNCGKAAQMKQLAQQAIQPGGIMGGGGGGGSGLGG